MLPHARRVGGGQTLAIVVGFAAACWSDPASASLNPLSEVHEDHPGHHHAAYPNLFGVRVGYVSIIEPAEEGAQYVPGFLAGVSYERTLIHEWLEMEASVPVAFGFSEDTTIALPIDVHLKKPFHPSPRVSPYVALGPAFDLQIEPELRVLFGGSAAVGTYVWPSRRVGIDIEFDYNLVVDRGELVHELLLAVGPVFRF